MIEFELPELKTRMRRMRKSPELRQFIRETQLSVNDLILPLFIKEGLTKSEPIQSMPGVSQLSLNDLEKELDEIAALGIKSLMLFGIPANKDLTGKESLNKDGIIQQAIKIIKAKCPEILVITDVCFCEYMSHGHCGIIDEHSHDVDNDATLKILGEQAVSHVQAGADMLAPSGMMDGQVAGIRAALDANNLHHIPLLVHSTKFASSFYGPFRDAAEGAPQFGDRKTYQMDPANSGEAMREVALDIAEGADMIMVKPATLYLDVLANIHAKYPSTPLCAYHVSGEYSMLKAGAKAGLFDEKKAALEALLAIKRAGARQIVTYYTKEVASWLKDCE